MTLDPAFDRALARVFDLEGGVADHAADRGGVTNMGISLRFLRSLGPGKHGGDLTGDGIIDYEDVLAVDPPRAAELYRRHFWQPSGADSIATIAEELAVKQFEFAVVAGPSRAVRALQRALTDARCPVAVDGSYGDRTHAAVDSVNRAGLAMELLQAMRRRQAEHFLSILARNKSQLVFAVGWLRRALDLDEAA